jgi:hypothetical protein
MFGLPMELVSIIIGAVTGFVSGLLGYNYQRWLQRRGRVTAKVDNWHFGMTKFSGYDEWNEKILVSVDSVSEADWASFGLELLIRNNREVAVEVRDLKFAFGKNREDVVEIDVQGPVIPGQGIGLKERYDMRLTVIPGEQSKMLELSGSIHRGTEEMLKLPTCNRVDLVAIYSKGERLRHRIALVEINH